MTKLELISAAQKKQGEKVIECCHLINPILWLPFVGQGFLKGQRSSFNGGSIWEFSLVTLNYLLER